MFRQLRLRLRLQSLDGKVDTFPLTLTRQVNHGTLAVWYILHRQAVVGLQKEEQGDCVYVRLHDFQRLFSGEALYSAVIPNFQPNS